jgi:dienelactone hydrolase
VLHRSFPLLLIAVLAAACEPAAELRHDAAGDDLPDALVGFDSAVVAEDAGVRAHDASSGLDASADAAKSPPDAALDTGAQTQADAASSDAGAASRDAGTMTSADASTGDAGAQPERNADFAVGTRRIEVSTDGGRVLPVQLWYPALDSASAEAAAGHAFDEFEAPGARRELLKKLFAAAPAGCTNATMHAAIDAQPYLRSAPFPVLVYSHHFDGTRFSMFSIAEALARAGMVVVAPDHVGASLFERRDTLTDTLSQGAAGLQPRVDDLRRVLDVMLDGKAEVVPEGLRGRMDATRVGALGHSMGGLTVGVYSVADTRVRASAYLAIVPSSSAFRPLLGLPEPARFRTPALYLSAAEDTVVEGQGGKQELAANFEAQPLPAYWIDVADAGHFSFADDVGLIVDFEEGCGMAQRSSNGEMFTYLDRKRAREIAAHYTAAFFSAELSGATRAPLGKAEPPELVTIKQRGH